MYAFMIAIYLLTGASFLALAAAGIQGYLDFPLFGGSHAAFGFLAAIVYLFTEVLVMFFFVGTGVNIKEYTRVHGGDSAFHSRSVAIKRRLYPPTLLNVVLVMTVFILGGGVDTRAVPAWVHGTLFLAALGHFAYTVTIQHCCFKENTEIILQMTAGERKKN